jgi:IS30 family transposase
MLQVKAKKKDIAKALGKHGSTIYRELKEIQLIPKQDIMQSLLKKIIQTKGLKLINDLEK